MKTNPFTAKMQAYCLHRAQGATQGDAARLAGYKGASAAISASRLEPRADVQAEIKRLKKEGASLGELAAPTDELHIRGTWQLKKRYASSLALMQDVYNNEKAPISVRIQAAKDALPYEAAKLAPLGKKAQKQADAEAATSGSTPVKSRFNTQRAPTNGRVVPLRQNG